MKNILIILILILILASGCIDNRAKVDLNTADFSKCMEQNSERSYYVLDHPEITERLQYNVIDDNDNHIQELLIKRYTNSRTARIDMQKHLSDHKCEISVCKFMKIKNYDAARKRTEYIGRLDSDHAPYNTEYYVLIGDLLITTNSYEYTWEESEKYAKSALDCIVNEMS